MVAYEKLFSGIDRETLVVKTSGLHVYFKTARVLLEKLGSSLATLCVRALGKQRVLGVIMHMVFTPSEDVEELAE